jgi:RNA polymerase sigma factor (sigma-70 family)
VSNQYNVLLVSQLSEPLDVDKNAELYPLVVAGDTTARETMINGNMPLVLAKVESFLHCFPNLAHLRDDLVSAGCVGLVKAVNQMAKGCRIRKPKNWNPTDYIGTAIYRKFSELMEDESPIRVPHTSKDRARAQGKELIPPVVKNTIPERFEVPSYEKELEMRDLIYACCTCDEERTFVAMREAGRTHTEIAAAINMSTPSVSRLKKKLEARVQAKLTALREE